MALIRVIGLYFRCFFNSVLRKNNVYSLAYTGLSQSHSYRLQQGANTDLLIGFRYLKKALALSWKNADGAIVHGIGNTAIFDAAAESMKARYSYISTITGESPKIFLHKEDLALQQSLLQRVIEVLFMILFSLWIIPLSIVSSKRGSYALNLLEIVENARLIQHLRKHKISKLYYFCGFNKDANFAAVLLQKNQIICHKVPSSNPIKNFYQFVIADVFSFTAPYQKQEYEHLKANWMVDRFEEWPVFHFEQIQGILNKYKTPKTNTLGFISSGIWRRIERGDNALGVGEYDSELRLIAFLKLYLNQNPQIQLFIFLHPIEKNNPEHYLKAQSHYQKVLGTNNIEFFEPSIPSFKLFDRVDLSVAAYSSANLERLYAGFKTLYAPLGIRSDYYADSSLNNIAAFDEKSLETLLNNSFEMNGEAFFEQNELQAYHNKYYLLLFQS